MFYKDRCDLCGDCIFMCNYMNYDREQSIEQFRRLVEGGTPEIVAQCLTCVACNQFCEKGANPFDLILARQEETGILDIYEEVEEMYLNLPNLPSEIIPGDPDKPYLDLCVVGDIIPRLFDGPLFEGMTVLKGGDYFCFAAWVHGGREDLVRKGAQRLVDNLAATGAKEVICYHDECYAELTMQRTTTERKSPSVPCIS